MRHGAFRHQAWAARVPDPSIFSTCQLDKKHGCAAEISQSANDLARSGRDLQRKADDPARSTPARCVPFGVLLALGQISRRRRARPKKSRSKKKEREVENRLKSLAICVTVILRGVRAAASTTPRASNSPINPRDRRFCTDRASRPASANKAALTPLRTKTPNSRLQSVAPLNANK